MGTACLESQVRHGAVIAMGMGGLVVLEARITTSWGRVILPCFLDPLPIKLVPPVMEELTLVVLPPTTDESARF
jgi:hypothetical protein